VDLIRSFDCCLPRGWHKSGNISTANDAKRLLPSPTHRGRRVAGKLLFCCFSLLLDVYSLSLFLGDVQSRDASARPTCAAEIFKRFTQKPALTGTVRRRMLYRGCREQPETSSVVQRISLFWPRVLVNTSPPWLTALVSTFLNQGRWTLSFSRRSSLHTFFGLCLASVWTFFWVEVFRGFFFGLERGGKKKGLRFRLPHSFGCEVEFVIGRIEIGRILGIARWRIVFLTF
jgi:hypothetical protein